MDDDRGAPVNKAVRGREAQKLLAELGAHESLDAAIALARRLLDRLRALDFHCYEDMLAAAAVPQLMRGPASDASRLLNETMRLVRSLPRLVGAEAPVVDDADETHLGPDPTAAMGASEGAPAPFQPGLGLAVSQDLDAALIAIQSTHWQRQGPATWAQLQNYSALCGRTVASLQEALDGLRAARLQRAKWGLIAEGEEARRRARKGLQVCGYVAMRLMAAADAAGFLAQEPTELQTSLWVREALMGFVTDMAALAAAAAPLAGAQLVAHLRAVRSRLLQLFGAAHYSELRAPDRYQLQQLSAALCQWLDHSKSDLSQAHALLHRAAGLAVGLGGINGREVLVAHDQDVARRAQAKLALAATQKTAAAGASAQQLILRESLEILQQMRWRSASLDAVVAAQLADLHAAESSSEAPGPRPTDSAFQPRPQSGAQDTSGRAAALVEALKMVRFV